MKANSVGESGGFSEEKRAEPSTQTQKNFNVLVVDDENTILQTSAAAIESIGHKAYTARNTRQALKNLNEHEIHLLFLDIHIGKECGLEFLRNLREAGNDLPVVMFTAFSSVESAIEAIKSGATDYIQKPLMPNELRLMLDRIKINLQCDESNGKKSLRSRQTSTILFETEEESVRRTMEIAEKAAHSHSNLLILGPSGTGKTVLSRH
ncbi:MAG: response regulator, partial [Puniceicoccales bacterium]